MKEVLKCPVCGKGFPRTHSTQVVCSSSCARMYRVEPLHVRFWKRIHKEEGENACWVWTGYRDKHGYGCGISREEPRVHRVSWILHNGPIPDGLGVLHSCDNPPCARPSHLFLGDDLDNQRDAAAKLRKPHGETQWFSKLTEVKVLEIRSLSGQIPQRKLAAMFNTTQANISDIVLGKSWKHLLVGARDGN